MGSKRSKDASSTSSTQQRDYLNCEISFGRRSAGKIPWEIELSTLPWCEGRSLWAVDDLTVDLDRKYLTQIEGDNAAP